MTQKADCPGQGEMRRPWRYEDRLELWRRVGEGARELTLIENDNEDRHGFKSWLRHFCAV